MTHAAQFSGLRKRLDCMWQASTEVLSSMRLRELLRSVLRIANYINHGSSDGAKALSVKSLPAFASFSVGSVSTLHYLCLTLCGPQFVAQLQKDLAHVVEASRESMSAQQQDVAAFGQCVAFTESQLKGFDRVGVCGPTSAGQTVGADGAAEGAKTRLSALHATLQEQHRVLQGTLERVRLHVEDTQRFFGDQATAVLAAEEFFGYIAGFMGLLASASVEVQQNPKRWQRFFSAAELQGEGARPRLKRSLSVPPESTQ
uniref:FH2 domain-containing protein n=1 Tax=Alexandrium catenella TaxID=2925 RepID=A0A7S1W2F2_ALECA